MSVEADRLQVLIEKFRVDDNAYAADLSAWTISPYQDAYVFVPNGVRSNQIHLVGEFHAVSFAPSTESMPDAYARLQTLEGVDTTDR